MIGGDGAGIPTRASIALRGIAYDIAKACRRDDLPLHNRLDAWVVARETEVGAPWRSAGVPAVLR